MRDGSHWCAVYAPRNPAPVPVLLCARAHRRIPLHRRGPPSFPRSRTTAARASHWGHIGPARRQIETLSPAVLRASLPDIGMVRSHPGHRIGAAHAGWCRLLCPRAPSSRFSPARRAKPQALGAHRTRSLHRCRAPAPRSAAIRGQSRAGSSGADDLMIGDCLVETVRRYEGRGPCSPSRALFRWSRRDDTRHHVHVRRHVLTRSRAAAPEH